MKRGAKTEKMRKLESENELLEKDLRQSKTAVNKLRRNQTQNKKTINTLEEKKLHRENARLQMNFYLRLKNTVLEDGNRHIFRLAVQDFTKAMHYNKRYNVLMVSVLCWNRVDY